MERTIRRNGLRAWYNLDNRALKSTRSIVLGPLYCFNTIPYRHTHTDTQQLLWFPCFFLIRFCFFPWALFIYSPKQHETVRLKWFTDRSDEDHWQQYPDRKKKIVFVCANPVGEEHAKHIENQVQEDCQFGQETSARIHRTQENSTLIVGKV